MTAAGSSGTVSPVCSPTHSHSSQSPARSACPPTCWRRKRKERILQTRLPLHLRSAPGVWLLLGVGVVLVGMSVAVAGYVVSAPRPVGGRGSSHADRMKLAGPVVMGVGLFVFICAATLLYENRDRELLKLVASDDLEDLKPDSGWEDSEQHDDSCQDRRESVDMEQASCSISSHARSPSNQIRGPPLSPRNRRNINSSSPDGQRGPWETPPPPPENGEALGGREGPGSEGKVGEGEGGSTRLTRVLHHQEPTSCYPSSHCPSPSTSSVYSDSCNSSEINFNIRTGLPPNDGQ